MSNPSLQEMKLVDLKKIARALKISGWHDLKKQVLISLIEEKQRANALSSENKSSSPKTVSQKNAVNIKKVSQTTEEKADSEPVSPQEAVPSPSLSSSTNSPLSSSSKKNVSLTDKNETEGGKACKNKTEGDKIAKKVSKTENKGKKKTKPETFASESYPDSETLEPAYSKKQKSLFQENQPQETASLATHSAEENTIQLKSKRGRKKRPLAPEFAENQGDQAPLSPASDQVPPSPSDDSHSLSASSAKSGRKVKKEDASKENSPQEKPLSSPSVSESVLPLETRTNPIAEDSLPQKEIKVVPSKLKVIPYPEITSKKSDPAPKTPSAVSPEKIESSEMSEEGLNGNSAGKAKADFLKEKLLLHKTLETPAVSGHEIQDRIVLLVCGPFWIHARWEISGALIAKKRAAMGFLWHTADPILRLYKVFSDGAGLLHREIVRDIIIHGGVYNWFINVDDPPASFSVEIGYKSKDGRFFALVSSNIVETPHDYLQGGFYRSESDWQGFSSNLPPAFDARSVGFSGPSVTKTKEESEKSDSFSAQGEIDYFNELENRPFDLQIDAEVVIKGKTIPDAQLTIKGERIWLKEDGSFLIRYHLPERRHVFPVVAVSRDGIETKTIVLAVERNTKILETVIRDQNDDE